MRHLSREYVFNILTAVDTERQRQGLSRRQLADALGIPFNSFRRWFSKTVSKMPSTAYLLRLELYLSKAKSDASQWNAVWQTIRDWWQTQHRYASAGELAQDIGWDGPHLDRCLMGVEAPPRLVLERLASILNIATPGTPPQIGQAQERIARLKVLLTLVHNELAWFRDGPGELRELLRAEMDPFDAGYISSLLAMLWDENKFRRWLAATTNRFAFFRRKGRSDDQTGTHPA